MNRQKKHKKKKKKSNKFLSVKIRKNVVEYLNPENYLNIEWIKSNIYFIAFSCAVMLFYISNNHHTIRTIRSIEKSEKELRDLRGEYVSLESELEKERRRSKVASRARDIGMEESKLPPVKLQNGK